MHMQGKHANSTQKLLDRDLNPDPSCYEGTVLTTAPQHIRVFMFTWIQLFRPSRNYHLTIMEGFGCPDDPMSYVVRCCLPLFYTLARVQNCLRKCPSRYPVVGAPGVWGGWLFVMGIQSLFYQSQGLGRIAGSKADPFQVRVSLRQGCFGQWFCS